MEPCCQRGTTDHVIPSTLTHDPVSWKGMSISHNLFTLIELLINQQSRTNPDNLYCNWTEIRDMTETGWWGQSSILKHRRGIVCPSHYGFWILNWHFKTFLNREIASRQHATYLLHLNWIYYLHYVYELCTVRNMF